MTKCGPPPGRKPFQTAVGGEPRKLSDRRFRGDVYVARLPKHVKPLLKSQALLIATGEFRQQRFTLGKQRVALLTVGQFLFKVRPLRAQRR